MRYNNNKKRVDKISTKADKLQVTDQMLTNGSNLLLWTPRFYRTLMTMKLLQSDQLTAQCLSQEKETLGEQVLIQLMRQKYLMAMRTK